MPTPAPARVLHAAEFVDRFGSASDALADVSVGLSGVTADEGPQILWAWQRALADFDGVRLVVKPWREPENEADGRVLYSCEGVPTVSHVADVLVMPRQVYYAVLFGRVSGQWYALPGGSAWAFSGDDPWLEETPVVTTIEALSEGLGSYDTTMRLTSTAELAVGDWLRVGPSEVLFERRLVRVLTIPAAGQVTHEPVAVFPAPTARQVRGVTFTLGAGGNSVHRSAGSWADDGWKRGMRGLARLTLSNDEMGLSPGAQREVAFSVLRIEGSVLYSDAFFVAHFSQGDIISGLVVEHSPGFVGGTPVVRMKQVGTAGQRDVYGAFPKQWREDDKDLANQPRNLVGAELDDGQKVNLGEPGVRYGLERFMRPLGALWGRQRAASEERPLLLDGDKAPAAFQRLVTGGLYGYLPPVDAPEWKQRALLALQPKMSSYAGVFDAVQAAVEACTGQTATVVRGANRVTRFVDPDSGFPNSYRFWPIDIQSTSIQVAGALVPGAFKGWSARPDASLNVEVEVLDNDADTFYFSGSPSILTLVKWLQATIPNPTDFFAGGGVTMTLSGDNITRSAGSFVGYTVGDSIQVVNTTLLQDGWFKVDALPAADDIQVVTEGGGAVSFTFETNSKGLVRGGVTPDAIAVDDTLVENEWTGYYAYPTNGDGRHIPIASNKPRRVVIGETRHSPTRMFTNGGTLNLGRQCQLMAPLGTRTDPMSSLYTPRATSPFNDFGVFFYVANDISDLQKRDLAGRLEQLLPAIQKVRVIADGGDAPITIYETE